MEKQVLVKNLNNRELFWEISVDNNIITTVFYHKDGKKKVYSKEIKGKKNITDEEQALKEALSRIEQKRNYGYTLLNESQYENFKCMLFNKFTGTEDWIENGCFQQPKLNGIRCIALYSGEWVLLNKDKKKFPYLFQIKKELELFLDKNTIYDGVLTIPHGFPTLFKLVNAKCQPDNEMEQLIVFNIFDIISEEIQHTRLKKLSMFVDVSSLSGCIKIVESIEVSSLDVIKNLHTKFINKGYEGSVLRSMKSIYEDRSFCVVI